ncbi:hypothetical protein BJX96DRAFT_116670 [Aspergillus floccosus]
MIKTTLTSCAQSANTEKSSRTITASTKRHRSPNLHRCIGANSILLGPSRSPIDDWRHGTPESGPHMHGGEQLVHDYATSFAQESSAAMSHIPLFCQFQHDGWRLVPKERHSTGMIHVVGCGRVADGYVVDLMISDRTFVDVESVRRAIRMDSSRGRYVSALAWTPPFRCCSLPGPSRLQTGQLLSNVIRTCSVSCHEIADECRLCMKH